MPSPGASPGDSDTKPPSPPSIPGASPHSLLHTHGNVCSSNQEGRAGIIPEHKHTKEGGKAKTIPQLEIFLSLLVWDFFSQVSTLEFFAVSGCLLNKEKALPKAWLIPEDVGKALPWRAAGKLCRKIKLGQVLNPGEPHQRLLCLSLVKVFLSQRLQQEFPAPGAEGSSRSSPRLGFPESHPQESTKLLQGSPKERIHSGSGHPRATREWEKSPAWNGSVCPMHWEQPHWEHWEKWGHWEHWDYWEQWEALRALGGTGRQWKHWEHWDCWEQWEALGELGTLEALGGTGRQWEHWDCWKQWERWE